MRGSASFIAARVVSSAQAITAGNLQRRRVISFASSSSTTKTRHHRGNDNNNNQQHSKSSSGHRGAAIVAAGACTVASLMALSVSHADADEEYLKALDKKTKRKSGVSSSPSSSPSSSSSSTERKSSVVVVDVAALNTKALKLRAKRIARGTPDLDEEEEDDEEVKEVNSESDLSESKKYVYSPPPSSSSSSFLSSSIIIPGNVVEIRSKLDVASIDQEVAVVAIVRGCHPAIAESILSSLKSAAKLAEDATSFDITTSSSSSPTKCFTYYAITDATPEPVCAFLQKILRADIEEPYTPTSSLSSSSSLPYSAPSSSEDSSSGSGIGRSSNMDFELPNAMPIVAVFDRTGKTRSKYILPFSDRATLEEELEASATHSAAATSAPTTILTEAENTLLAVFPYPSEIVAFLDSFVRGTLRPTLLGAPRPVGDVYPHHPTMAQVVSSSFDEIVLDPSCDVCLEAYLTHCPMCMCLAPRVRMLSILTKQYLPSTIGPIKVAGMNVDENDRPMDWMPGPAFPTIQLFNKGTGTTATTTTPATGGKVVFTKAGGPRCQIGLGNNVTDASSTSSIIHLPTPEAFEAGHATTATSSNSPTGSLLKETSLFPPHSHIVPPTDAPASSIVVKARTSSPKGSPPCVPAIDFTHPTAPGKMALPSVLELLGWVATHGSTPFIPANIRVPKSAMLNSASRYAEMLPPAPATAQEESALLVGGEEGSSSSSATSATTGATTSDQQQDTTISLTELAADMDAEARVLEYAIFDTFFYEHVADMFGKAVGVLPNAGTPVDIEEEKCGGQSAVIGEGALPTYNTPVWREKYAAFKAAVDTLREVAIERSTYGTADASLDAMDMCGAMAADPTTASSAAAGGGGADEGASVVGIGARNIARQFVADQEEMKIIAKALPLAVKLLSADIKEMK